MPSPINGSQCILLSFFSGIEVAALAVQDLIGPILLHISWEIDPACQEIIQWHFPDAHLRGDVLQEDADAIANLVNKHDPHETCMVLFCSAPPCPDFSQISSSAQGFSGQEGSKFTAYTHLSNEIESRLGNRQIRYLVENVVMQKPEADYISRELRAQPIVADASAFGLVNRPRLFWTRVSWDEQRHHPLHGGDLHWGKHNGFRQLLLDVPKDDINQIWTPDLEFHDRVKQGHARLPCFTTPAPDDHGRPAPKKSRGKISEQTRHRWLQGQRQFAPWHYEEAALLRDLHGNLIIPPPVVKEQLHHLPIGYTANQHGDDRTRHHMMGNSWHRSVVIFLLMFVLQWSPTTGILPPSRPRYNCQCNWQGKTPVRWDLAWVHPKEWRYPYPRIWHPTGGMQSRRFTHWCNHHTWNQDYFTQYNVCKAFMEIWLGFDRRSCKTSSNRWRNAMMTLWHGGGRYHPMWPQYTSTEMISPSPKFLCCWNFWRHAGKQGKISGPYRGPSSWPVSTVSNGDTPLSELPCQVRGVSICFSVVQSDKIRRCEDFRRSFHNDTIKAQGACLWAHDLDAAYRQFPISDPSYAYVILCTPKEVTLWQHNALSFRATASVWSFNRAADGMMFLARQLLLIPTLHFVDDFGGVEPTETADSAFHCFGNFFAALGLRMKTKKALAPKAHQKILGVYVSITNTEVWVQPCPVRLQKIQGAIEEALLSNHLTPDGAQKLAGKLIFLQTSSFGQIGKASLHSVYGRAAAIQVTTATHLWLTHCEPPYIHWEGYYPIYNRNHCLWRCLWSVPSYSLMPSLRWVIANMTFTLTQSPDNGTLPWPPIQERMGIRSHSGLVYVNRFLLTFWRSFAHVVLSSIFLRPLSQWSCWSWVTTFSLSSWLSTSIIKQHYKRWPRDTAGMSQWTTYWASFGASYHIYESTYISPGFPPSWTSATPSAVETYLWCLLTSGTWFNRNLSPSTTFSSDVPRTLSLRPPPRSMNVWLLKQVSCKMGRQCPRWPNVGTENDLQEASSVAALYAPTQL